MITRGLLALAFAVACTVACGASDDDSGGQAGSSGTGGTSHASNVYVSSLRGVSGGSSCLPRPLAPGTGGQVPCSFVEVRPSTAAACPACTSPGRVAVTNASFIPAINEFRRNSSECDGTGLPACSASCACELAQFSGDELLTCETALTDPGTADGFCYVDATVDVNGDGTPDANPMLWAQCDASEPRVLRFLGAGVPASDASVYVTCAGAVSN